LSTIIFDFAQIIKVANCLTFGGSSGI